MRWPKRRWPKRRSPNGAVAVVVAIALASREARGQGLRWSTTFDPQNAPTDQVFALHAFDDGSGPALYVDGDFHWAGSGPSVNHIARWDGAAWSPLGSGLGDDLGGFGSVYALASYNPPSGPVLSRGRR